MSDNQSYYLRRIEEEMAAAVGAENASIAQIHRDMARRYRDLVDDQAVHIDGEPRLAQVSG